MREEEQVAESRQQLGTPFVDWQDVPLAPLVLSTAQVHSMLGIGRSKAAFMVWVHREERAKRFPRRVRVGGRVGWHRSEIEEYIRDLPRGPKPAGDRMNPAHIRSLEVRAARRKNTHRQKGA